MMFTNYSLVLLLEEEKRKRREREAKEREKKNPNVLDLNGNWLTALFFGCVFVCLFI